MKKIYKLENINNRMKLKLMMIVTLLFLILPFVSAQKIYVKQYEAVTIPLPCNINGEYCSPAAICKTTIIDPDKNVLFNNQTMSRNDAVFEINLSESQTVLTGDYQFNVVCSDAGKSSSRFLEFEVNPTGTGNGITLFVFLILSSFFVLLMGVLLKNEYIGFFSGLLFMTTGVYALIYGISDLSNLYTRTIGYSAIGLGILFEIASAISAIESGTINIMGDNDDF